MLNIKCFKHVILCVGLHGVKWELLLSERSDPGSDSWIWFWPLTRGTDWCFCILTTNHVYSTSLLTPSGLHVSPLWDLRFADWKVWTPSSMLLTVLKDETHGFQCHCCSEIWAHRTHLGPIQVLAVHSEGYQRLLFWKEMLLLTFNALSSTEGSNWYMFKGLYKR